MGKQETGVTAEEVRNFLKDHPVLYAATLGFDKQPAVHPVRLCFEEDGAFYFSAAKCETFYGELSLRPAVSLCVSDPAAGLTFFMKGEAVFTEEEAVTARCLREDARLQQRYGAQPEMVIAWFLKDVACTFRQEEDGTERTIRLGDPAGVLTGIRLKKDKELRDRLVKIMAAREEEHPSPASEEEMDLQKLYDGAVLYVAETAKGLWPRMDIRPIERSLLYETYDERERYVNRAKEILGNTVIDKPEDLTWWLNKETLRGKEES